MTKPNELLNDASLLDAVRRCDNLVLERLFREYRPRVVGQIIKQGGTAEEAKDIFQEAFTAIFLKSQQPDFQLTSSFSTFLHAICQNLWLKKYREKSRQSGVSIENLVVSRTDDDAQQAIEQHERHSFFLQKFAELGEECRKLLQLSIVEEKSADEIIAMLGFGSIGYLYKRKSNCKDKLVQLVRQDRRFKEFRT